MFNPSTKRLLIWVAATPIALGAVWVLANLALRGQAPAPRFTERDLPAVPAESDNGWVGLAMRGERIVDTKVSPAMVSILDAQATEMLSKALAARPEIDALLRTPGASHGLSLWTDAMRLPRFADACPLQVESACAVMVVLKAHQLAMLSALRSAVDADWDAAIRDSAVSARASLDFAATSRTLIATHVSGVAVKHWTSVLEAVLAAHASAGSPTLAPATRAALDDARQKLAALEPASVSLKRTVIAEYVFTRHALDAAARAPTNPVERMGYSIFYDPRATWAELDARSDALLAAIAAHTAPPMAPRLGEHPLWWAYNPVGKISIDGMVFSWAPQLERAERDRARSLEAATRIRNRVAAMIATQPVSDVRLPPTRIEPGVGSSAAPNPDGRKLEEQANLHVRCAVQ